MTRRDALSWRASPFTTALALAFTGGRVEAAEVGVPTPAADRPHADVPHAQHGGSMDIYYLEIVRNREDEAMTATALP